MYDPNNQGDFNSPRQGFFEYLQGQGYGGQMGPGMRQYAQGLRQQGQHPRWDYMHPGQPFPGMSQGMGLGGLAGPQTGGGAPMGQMPQGQSFAYQNPTAPRPMQAPMPSYQGTAQAPQMQGLAGLSAMRKPVLQPR